MSRTRRSALIGTIVFGFVTCVGLAFAYFANFRAEEVAKSVLEQVRELYVGKSTETDVQRLVNENGGEGGGQISGVCGPNAKSHSFQVSSSALNWMGLKSPVLRPFGNRYWAANIFLVTEDQVLCYASYEIRAFDKRNSITASASMKKGFNNPEVAPYDVSVGFTKGTHFRSSVTTDATDDQVRRAFEFNLDCLSRFGGCRSGCEVMPLAWIDYQKKAKENGWELPADEVADVRCQKH